MPACAGINWKSIRFEPSRTAPSSPGTSQHFLVTGLNGADLEDDLTHSPDCSVTSSNPAVVEVDQARGLLIAKSPGSADVRASFSGVTTVTRVQVESRPAQMSVSFSPGIISILTTKGCNGSGCHGSPAGQSGFKLSLFGYDVNADYQMIVKGHDGRRVNLDNPEKSLVL